MKDKIKMVLRVLLGALFILGGIAHFTKTQVYLNIMPSYIPWHLAMVYISGVIEIILGIAVMIPQFKKLAGYGLIGLLIAIFPANINMAINNISFGDAPASPAFLWGRLPIQLLLIVWAYWVTKESKKKAH
ncbi:MAG: putative membrane protein [bacterium]|jgi:uncharacterized membrane protein